MLDPWKGTKLTHSFFQTNRNKYLVLKEIEWRISVKLMYLFDPRAELSCLYNFLSLNCRMDRIENILGTVRNKNELLRPEDLAALELQSCMLWALQRSELMLVTPSQPVSLCTTASAQLLLLLWWDVTMPGGSRAAWGRSGECPTCCLLGGYGLQGGEGSSACHLAGFGNGWAMFNC